MVRRATEDDDEHDDDRCGDQPAGDAGERARGLDEPGSGIGLGQAEDHNDRP
jgi:hypothetical protein